MPKYKFVFFFLTSRVFFLKMLILNLEGDGASLITKLVRNLPAMQKTMI